MINDANLCLEVLFELHYGHGCTLENKGPVHHLLPSRKKSQQRNPENSNAETQKTPTQKPRNYSYAA
ncbi:hypothetical protein CFP56_022679 [Quercus suber]|uniref:Uncharacterized protein n=1 Tax=Quercus suber TaxID=58331 RepID=A0AAW0LY39_QUESU